MSSTVSVNGENREEKKKKNHHSQVYEVFFLQKNKISWLIFEGRRTLFVELHIHLSEDKDSHLEEFRRTESTKPQEASFCRSFPHARQYVKDVSLCGIPLYPEYVIIVCRDSIDYYAKFSITSMRINSSP